MRTCFLFVSLVLAVQACGQVSLCPDRWSVEGMEGKRVAPGRRSHDMSIGPEDADTIAYDDGWPTWFCVQGSWYAVRFIPERPCTVLGALVMTLEEGSPCTLWVWDDMSGQIGPPVDGPVVLTGGSYPDWELVAFDASYMDTSGFWIGGRFTGPPWPLADSLGDGDRSSWSFDGQQWYRYTNGDLMVRALVGYGDTLDHDVAVYDIGGIPDGVWAADSHQVHAMVANLGREPETLWVDCAIDDGEGIRVYQDSVINTIASGTSGAIHFSYWTVEGVGQVFHVTAWTDLVHDQNTRNDTAWAVVESYPEGELAFDDFTAELWHWVGLGDNDRFAVRFSPYVLPYVVSSVRFYVDGLSPFERVVVCLTDSASGLPDLSQPIATERDVAAQDRPGWVTVPFDTSETLVDTESDLWVVVEWPDSGGAHVGADRGSPIDRRSYWYSEGYGWDLWTSSEVDFMIRVTIHTQGGIEYNGFSEYRDVYDLLPCPLYPNPASQKVFCTYAVPPSERGHMLIRVYDSAGRLVKKLVDKEVEGGRHRIRWDGVSDGGRVLPSGIYFIRAEGFRRCDCRKLLWINS
jgi:hypothetical protein